MHNHLCVRICANTISQRIPPNEWQHPQENLWLHDCVIVAYLALLQAWDDQVRKRNKKENAPYVNCSELLHLAFVADIVTL